MKIHALAIPWLLALASCSTPPKPPSVDESNRRPANARAELDLQVCKGELRTARILASEDALAASATDHALHQMAYQHAIALAAGAPGAAGELREGQATPVKPASTASAPVAPIAPSTVRVVHFAFGSSRLALDAGEMAVLAEEASRAPLIVLRGRTDGTSDTAAESRVARERAEAVRALLVAEGIAPARIRTTWQPTGDHVADNQSPIGRALNRRVEIELYRVPPTVAGFQRAVAPG